MGGLPYTVSPPQASLFGSNPEGQGHVCLCLALFQGWRGDWVNVDRWDGPVNAPLTQFITLFTPSQHKGTWDGLSVPSCPHWHLRENGLNPPHSELHPRP